jgi:type I site-specific restriction endonuclease
MSKAVLFRHLAMAYESEKQTRKQLIDALLKQAGWRVIPYSDQMDFTSLTGRAV